MRVLLLSLALVAVVFGQHHGSHDMHHNHPKHNHHMMMMKTVHQFDTCTATADGDESELGVCISKHLTDMQTCIEGLDNRFKTMGLPKPVMKFVGCFKALNMCMAAKKNGCTANMRKCVAKKNPGEKKGKFMKHVPPPIKKSIAGYIACKKADAISDLDCTKKHIKEVANILTWAQLGRCQMGQFLCEALGGDNCLETLTDADKKCVKKAPTVPNTEGAPQKLATAIGAMAEALRCWTSAATEQDNTKYVDCVYNSKWIGTRKSSINEIRHVYCYTKLKSCNAEKSTCTSEYAECRGDGH